MKFRLTALLFCCGIALQAQVIQGVAKDKSNGEAIAYLSLGIEGTRVGTLTEKSGQFKLTIPDSLRNRKLTLYGLGYDRLDLPLSSFFGRGAQEILMQPLSTNLDQVTLDRNGSASYIEEEFLTAKRKVMQRAYRSLSPKNPEHSGTTIASRISVTQPHWVVSASVFVAETTTDSLKFRVRIFDIDKETGLPGNDLFQNPAVHSFAGQKGWVTIGLEDHYLFLDKSEYFLGFELIEEKEERYRVYNARKEYRTKLKSLNEEGVKGIQPVTLQRNGKEETHYRISLSPKKMKKLGLNPFVFTTKFEMVKGDNMGVYRSSSFENWTVSDLGVFRMKLNYEYEGN